MLPLLSLLYAVPLATLDKDADTLTQAAVFIGGLTAVAVIGNQLIGVAINWRKLKGADPGDDQRYATRQEHVSLKNEVTGMKSDYTTLLRTMNASFEDIQRSLGRIEGEISVRGAHCRKTKPLG